MTRAMLAAAIASAIAAPRLAAAATDLQPRVLVLPTEGDALPSMPKLGADIADALARGAGKTTRNVARADATLTDTAVIVGCDPAQHACLDAVAAALNVDQVVFARVHAGGHDATVDVTAVTRETEPQARTFTIRSDSRAADIAALEPAVVEMLESGEARRSQAHHDAAATTTTTTASTALPIAPKPPAAEDTEVERPAWPIAITAGGAALAIAGASCWAVASSKQSEINTAPTNTVADLDHLASLETSARRYALAGNVLVIGGAAAAIAGAALWWQSWHATRGVAIAPSIGPDQASLVVGGVW